MEAIQWTMSYFLRAYKPHGLARRYVETSLQEQADSAATIARHFKVPVYVFLLENRFAGMTPKVFKNVEYYTDGTIFAVLNQPAQQTFSDNNQYLQFTVDHSLYSSDKLGVQLPYVAALIIKVRNKYHAMGLEVTPKIKDMPVAELEAICGDYENQTIQSSL